MSFFASGSVTSSDTRLRVAARKQLHDCVIACGLPHIGRGDLPLVNSEGQVMGVNSAIATLGGGQEGRQAYGKACQKGTSHSACLLAG